jgi:hypothetical protein
VVAALVAGCGSTTTSTDHRLLAAGASAIADSGCEACHMIGADGNPGPGPGLTTIGARLSAAQITEALDDPTAPMPSFKYLPPRDFKAIVAYLASLKARRDVIAVAGPSAAQPTPLPISPALCKYQKLVYSTVIARLNTHTTNPQTRAGLKQIAEALRRAVHQACRFYSRRSS